MANNAKKNDQLLIKIDPKLKLDLMIYAAENNMYLNAAVSQAIETLIYEKV
jgi:predicted HicB family RNase H-like nuclease